MTRNYTTCLILFFLLAYSASLAIQLDAGLDVLAAHVLVGVLLDQFMDDLLRRKEVV